MAARRENDYVIGTTRGNPGRRNNAPVMGRRRRKTTTVPDLLIALAATGFTMAIVFTIISFGNDNVTAGEAGRILARMFAGALAVAAVLVAVLAVGLLRDERGQADHYVVPILIGLVIGVCEAVVFLLPAGAWLPYPFLLLFFALRPVRRVMARLAGGGRR